MQTRKRCVLIKSSIRRSLENQSFLSKNESPFEGTFFVSEANTLPDSVLMKTFSLLVTVIKCILFFTLKSRIKVQAKLRQSQMFPLLLPSVGIARHPTLLSSHPVLSPTSFINHHSHLFALTPSRRSHLDWTHWFDWE